MSGEDNNTNNNTDMMTAILEAINNSKNDINNLRNDLKNDININNQSINEKFDIIQDKFESMQAENAATREELISRIDTRSRVSTRAPSRATSPRQLATRLEELSMKMPELEPVVKVPELGMPLETPRPVYSGVVYTEPRLTMTEIFKDKQAADDFAEQNKLRDKRKPVVNKRDNTISSRETFAAINRPGNPVMKETFTRTTPDNKARLSSPLTLEKCLTFERDMLDFQQKYNVEVRYTNYVDADLKYEIRARFELTDSNFYELSQQELHRCLSEMIAPMTKEEFLSMLKKAVRFSLPHGYIPTEQNVVVFLNQLLVYKEKLIRAIEFLLLHPDTDAALPACDGKQLGLLRLISDEVPFEFIQRMMNADGTSKKYKDVFEFFKRVALKAADHVQLSKAAKVFGVSFGGTLFEQNERNHQHPLANTNARSDDKSSVVVTKAATIPPPIPYRKWTPRVAIMESVPEDGEEFNDENEDPVDNVMVADEPIASDNVSALIQMASDRLGQPCFRMVSNNSCQQVNCEYSHDKMLVAAARDKKIKDLMAVKQSLLEGHNNRLKSYDKAGAKSFKPTASPITVQRKPVSEERSPQISLLQQPLGPGDWA